MRAHNTRAYKKLTPNQIWQIADTDNKGFLTPSGFGVVLRLIGHAQAGRNPTAQLATQGMFGTKKLTTLLTTSSRSSATIC